MAISGLWNHGGSMHTLYVTDLDGTLLNSSDKISQYSIEIINGLVAKGMQFTYATARSLVSASMVAKGLLRYSRLSCG